MLPDRITCDMHVCFCVIMWNTRYLRGCNKVLVPWTAIRYVLFHSIVLLVLVDVGCSVINMGNKYPNFTFGFWLFGGRDLEYNHAYCM
jgi:hypothetical protein